MFKFFKVKAEVLGVAFMDSMKFINVCGYNVYRKSLGLLTSLAGYMPCAPTSEKHWGF
jgi:hypothetical protein